ncbi:hypothetical protein F4055_14200 [Candidatus Poribacteria bacterium]|nr:hypothetical protein [Candidatus Poribacteria bacterium]
MKIKYITFLFALVVTLMFVQSGDSTPYQIEKTVYEITPCYTDAFFCGDTTYTSVSTRTVSSHNHTGSHPSTVKRTVTRYLPAESVISCSECGGYL